LGEFRGHISTEECGDDNEEPGNHHDALSVDAGASGQASKGTFDQGRSRLRMPREPTHGM
jgi:hypothetical protein